MRILLNESMADDLKKYNDLLAKTYIDIPEFSDKGIALPSKANKNQTYTISLNQSDKVVQTNI